MLAPEQEKFLLVKHPGPVRGGFVLAGRPPRTGFTSHRESVRIRPDLRTGKRTTPIQRPVRLDPRPITTSCVDWPCVQSGRQDLNLRPHGPEAWLQAPRRTA